MQLTLPVDSGNEASLNGSDSLVKIFHLSIGLRMKQGDLLVSDPAGLAVLCKLATLKRRPVFRPDVARVSHEREDLVQFRLDVDA